MRRKKKLHSATSSSSGMTQPRTLGQPAADDLAGVLDLVRLEVLDQLRVLDARGHEDVRALAAFAARLLELAADGLIADGDLDDLVGAHQRLELAVGDRASAGAEKPGLRDGEQQQQAEHVPDGERRPLRGQRPAFAGLCARREAAAGDLATSAPVRPAQRRLPSGRRARRRRRRSITVSPSPNSPSSTRRASGSSTSL